MKTLLARGQEALHSDALQSVTHFADDGTVIHNGRNIIKVFDTPSGRLNVKAYRVPGLLNRIIYSFFRKPKGRRGFEYPLRMAQSGVATPAPIAYVEEHRFGLIAHSWLVTLHSPLCRKMYEFGDKAVYNPADEAIVRAFARFTAAMHNAGVLHLDYSPGNILFDCDKNGEWLFEVVDVNRMRFGKVSVREGCRNFARLWGQPAFFRILAEEYAAERGADAESCFNEIALAREKFWRRFSRRHKIKYAYRSLV